MTIFLLWQIYYCITKVVQCKCNKNVWTNIQRYKVMTFLFFAKILLKNSIILVSCQHLFLFSLNYIILFYFWKLHGFWYKGTATEQFWLNTYLILKLGSRAISCSCYHSNQLSFLLKIILRLFEQNNFIQWPVFICLSIHTNPYSYVFC